MRRVLSLALLCLALAVSFAGGSGGRPAAGQSSEENVHSLQEHIQEASAEEGRLLEQIEGASARKAELDAKVAAIDGEIAPVQARLSAAESRLSGLEARQRVVETELEGARAQLAEAKDDLARQAIAAYTGGSEAAQFAQMLLNSSTIGELAAKRTYIKAAAGSQAETIALIEHLRDQVQDLLNQVDASRAEAEVERDTVSDQRAELQSKRNAQESVRGQVAAEVGTLNQARGEILARKEEFEAQVRALEEESRAVAEALRARQSSAAAEIAPGVPSDPDGSSDPGPAATSNPGGLVSPLPGSSIVSGFGNRVHPVYGTVRMHTGVDMSGSTGTPIHAAGDGVVVSAGSMGGYGNATVIDHGGGLATLYGHQSSVAVSEGQRVSQGEIIGRVGCTGTCTGPHLHFEVRVNGTPVNPMSYI